MKKVFESEKSNYKTSFLCSSYVMDNEVSVKKYKNLKNMLNQNNSRVLEDLDEYFTSDHDFVYSFNHAGKNILFIAVKLENFKKKPCRISNFN